MNKKMILAVFAGLMSSSVYAHHPLGGLPMESFTDGVLSGVGHPLLGFDHLFFVILIGIAATYTGFKRTAPLAYIVAMVVGCLLMSFGVGLPIKEVVIGLSLVVVGYFVLSGKALTMPAAVGLFAAFGLFHGSAFGDSIATQESAVGGAVLVGYLIGLGAVQYLIAVVAGLTMIHVWKAFEATAIAPRMAGAAMAGVGVFLTMENLEGMIIPALGWAT